MFKLKTTLLKHMTEPEENKCIILFFDFIKLKLIILYFNNSLLN